MIKQRPKNQIIIAVLAVLMFTACSKLKKARDLISNPSAKEIYEREFKEAPELFSIWEAQTKKALSDSIIVNLPYAEAGEFFPRSFPIYSYELQLNPGERLHVDVETDSLETLVFIDLFKKEKNGSVPSFQHVESAEFGTTDFQKEISKAGTYKLLVQPEIAANTPFQLKIYSEPIYSFPVASKGNAAIQSAWGAVRDGGRRSHEGIDIFAARGTPVLAVTEGRISSTGNKGLGGKQVWLRDRKRENSLYYAHLDSIIAVPGMKVSPGDTIGLVGNTGNARTTPPHLHFGIYKSYRGAVNPLPYVYQTEEPVAPDFSAADFKDNLLIGTARANLRSAPSTNSIVLDQAEPEDTLQMLGKTENWFHVRQNDESYFIHQSLVSALE